MNWFYDVYQFSFDGLMEYLKKIIVGYGFIFFVNLFYSTAYLLRMSTILWTVPDSGPNLFPTL